MNTLKVFVVSALMAAAYAAGSTQVAPPKVPIQQRPDDTCEERYALCMEGFDQALRAVASCLGESSPSPLAPKTSLPASRL